MENKSKNQISTFLLVTGVIFIMIAGSIFVTTAWQHLSETGKRLILTGIVAGLYVASWKLREKGALTKTEHALYYLATAGTGFITVSFLGGWSTVGGYLDSINQGGLNNADRAMWGLLAAAVGIAYRFFREKKAWDFGILSFIFINMFFLVFEANVHDIAGLIPLAGLVALATFQYVNTGKIGYRITQSLELVFINCYFVWELYELVHEGGEVTGDSDAWWYFACLVINLVLMALLQRKELVYTAVTFNWLMAAAQMLDGFDNWKQDAHLYDIVPFALTTAVCFMIMWQTEKEEKYGKLAALHGIMAAFDLIIYVMVQTDWYDSLGWDALLIAAMCMCIMIAFVFEMVDCVLIND